MTLPFLQGGAFLSVELLLIVALTVVPGAIALVVVPGSRRREDGTE